MKNNDEITILDLMNAIIKTKTEILSQMATKNDITRSDQRIDALDKKFESKFDLLDRRINTLDQKFESKFDMLFDAVGDINEKFTVMDYKFLQLKRQVHAT